MSAPTPCIEYGPDSAVYQLLRGAELAEQTEGLLRELKLDNSGAVLPGCEALVDGSKDLEHTPLDTPEACVIQRFGKVYPFAFRMMLHIGGDKPGAGHGRERNTTCSHDYAKQKTYTWEELPVIAHLRCLVAKFFGLAPENLAGANLYAYRGPAACLKPRQDGVPNGLQGPIVYSLSLSQGEAWRYVWKTELESTSFIFPSGAVNVLGQGTNSLGTHSVPASSVRAETAWRVSINFRPTVVAPPPLAPPVLFFSHAEGEPYNCFSNFWIGSFTYVLPLSCRRTDFPHEFRVVCAESAIMLTKAVVMGDSASMDSLVRDTTRAECDSRSAARSLAKKAKAIGRKVTNFDSQLWDTLCPEIANSIVLQKFQASERSRETLLGTGSRRIAEAATRDARWGIGVGAKRPQAQDPDKWPEQGNLLGKALEQARETLGGEPVVKKRRLCGPVHERPWGFFITASDAGLPEEALAAASAFTSPSSLDNAEHWQRMGQKRNAAEAATHLRMVCGGRKTEDVEVPAAARTLLDAAAALLQRMGKCEEADLTRHCDNVTMNVYKAGAKLAMHQDPPDYHPFVVCVTLHKSRSMAFSHPEQGQQNVTVCPGSIYVIRNQGYTQWKHGMRHQATEYTASVSGRVRLRLP